MRIAVVVCTLNHTHELTKMLDDLAHQTYAAETVIISTPYPDRLRLSNPLTVSVVSAPLGLTKQRNAALDVLDSGIDAVAFLDDHMVLADDYIERAVEFLRARPEVVLFSGNVLADGVRQGGLSRQSAERAISASMAEDWWRPAKRVYGCTMIVRRAIAQAVRFDERLTGYGWLEDRDFGFRCAQRGEVGYYGGCRVVHLGQQSGAASGLRFGFAQVVNPLYLWRKGSMPLRVLVFNLCRSSVRNVVAFLARDTRQGRNRRLRGNWIGLRSVLAGGITPEKVESVGE